MNVKDNVIQNNQIWAQAFGYRVNFDIPDRPGHVIHRREVYDTIKDLVDL